MPQNRLCVRACVRVCVCVCLQPGGSLSNSSWQPTVGWSWSDRGLQRCAASLLIAVPQVQHLLCPHRCTHTALYLQDLGRQMETKELELV